MHKRALGRKYLSEQAELRLFVAFAQDEGVVWLDELTPVLLDDFLGSRPRSRPRSFNHLLGVVACLLDWAVNQQLLWSHRSAPAGAAAALTGSRSCLTLSRRAGCLTQPPRLRTTPARRKGARPTGRCSRSATGSDSAPARCAGCGWATSRRAVISSWSAAGSSAYVDFDICRTMLRPELCCGRLACRAFRRRTGRSVRHSLGWSEALQERE